MSKSMPHACQDFFQVLLSVIQQNVYTTRDNDDYDRQIEKLARLTRPTTIASIGYLIYYNYVYYRQAPLL